MAVAALLTADGGTAASIAQDDHQSGSRSKWQVERRKTAAAKSSNSDKAQRTDSIAGALARSLLGVIALFFRAPIRLYRPVKLSSWSILESLAKREGKKLNLRYLRSVLKRERASFLPHLLGPPLIINTLIGFTLFESYSLCERLLLRTFYPKRLAAADTQKRDAYGHRIVQWSPLWVVGTSGFVAGAAQCIISAPLDNVRTILTARQKQQHQKHGQRIRPLSVKGTATHGRRGTPAAAVPVRISWRAILRAAVLPFAPEQAHTRLVQKVRDDAPRERWRDCIFGSLSRAAVWTGDLANGIRSSKNPKESGAAQAAEREKAEKLTASQRREQWEAQLRRWRGGVHGAGLLLSLARDSVGFSAFFVIFEVSRRVAYTVSVGVDKIYALASPTATLPASMHGGIGGGREHAGDNVEIEDVKTDYSYRAGRSLSGRLLAAFILVCGGAIGATFYELLGRPAELMRTVIWEGRKAWEEGRLETGRVAPMPASAKASKAAASKARERGARAARRARDGHRATLRGARLQTSSANTKLGSRRTIELRRGHTGGTMSTRLSSLHGLQVPLRLCGHRMARRTRAPDAAVPHLRRAEQMRRRLHPSRYVTPPTLENRPSAWSLLEAHAERTSPLRWATSAAAKARVSPTPVPRPILFLHTYFINPFIPYRPRSYAEEEAAAVHRSTARRKAAQGKSPEQLMRQRWTLNNPIKLSVAPERSKLSVRSQNALQWLSSLPGSVRTIAAARRWGSGRLTFVLRRLATPYGAGFVAFAWLGGDLAA